MHKKINYTDKNMSNKMPVKKRVYFEAKTIFNSIMRYFTFNKRKILQNKKMPHEFLLTRLDEPVRGGLKISLVSIFSAVFQHTMHLHYTNTKITKSNSWRKMNFM